MDRRRLLQWLGLANGTLFLPSLLGDRQAYAAPPPKRVVIFNTQHGPMEGTWSMRRPGLPDVDKDWEFPFDDTDPTSFSEALRPLHRVRKDVLILDGLAMTSAIAQNPGNNHYVAKPYRLACGVNSDKLLTSFDQYIAEKVAVPGRFKYIGLSTADGSSDYAGAFTTSGAPVVYAAGISQNGNLAGQLESIFGRVSTTGPTPPSPAELLARKNQENVANFLKAEYAKVIPKLGSEDRTKLTEHRDMLANLSKQLSDLPSLTCNRPPTPGKVAVPHAEDARIIMTQLLPMAMACDLTRVGMLEEKQLGSSEIGAPYTQNVHNEIAHSRLFGSLDKPTGTTLYMINYNKFHAEQFAKMVEAFAAVKEGNGTMLDNSLLIWIPELASGEHNLFRMMYVMAGGAGGSFRTGRYIKYAETGPNPSQRGVGSSDPNQPYSNNNGPRTSGLGPAHNKLFVSIMQAMGVTRNSIGIDKLVGNAYQYGMPIDMTGPLPRLA